jgi:hypothetical protein
MVIYRGALIEWIITYWALFTLKHHYGEPWSIRF